MSNRLIIQMGRMRVPSIIISNIYARVWGSTSFPSSKGWGSQSNKARQRSGADFTSSYRLVQKQGG